jgi:hypothetical protein
VPVGRELQQRGGARQARAPEIQLLLQALPRQVLALPEREVGVLHRQLGERRGEPGGEGGVQLAHLAHQHAHAPPVADDVVHGEEHHVVGCVQDEQRGAQQRPARQVEGVRRLGVAQAPRLPLAVGRRQAGKVHGGEAGGGGGQDHLHGLALAGRGEDGAQRLVPADDLAQGAPQRAGIQRAAEPHPRGHVVGGAAGVELVDEPQALLRERQRHRPAPRAARDVGRRGGGALRAAPLRQHLLQERAARRREVFELFGGQLHPVALPCL